VVRDGLGHEPPWVLVAVVQSDRITCSTVILVGILSPIYSSKAEIPPGLLLTLDHVARVDDESRWMLLTSDALDFLGKYLLQLKVSQLAHLTILLPCQCLLASPTIQVLFSRNQLFEYL
jgi:hypothetical protein